MRGSAKFVNKITKPSTYLINHFEEKKRKNLKKIRCLNIFFIFVASYIRKSAYCLFITLKIK
jgi:hypothetical protein